jgi:hypothetical protein
MNVHKHLLSQEEIHGIKLGPGAVLGELDRYDSRNGCWTLCPAPGLTIRSGCETIWIRPGELTRGGKDLLRQLYQNNALLSDFGHWRMIPTANAKRDGRVGDAVNSVGAIQEMIDLGFVCKDESDPQLYPLTETGRKYAEFLTS